MDPPRQRRRITDRQKSKEPLSLEQEFPRIREPVAASERKEIKTFLEKLATDVQSEIQFLQDMIDFQSDKYYYPFENSEAMENFIRNWIGLNISKGQMGTQMNKLKGKCEKRAKKIYEEHGFLSDDEGEALMLGKRIWGSEIKAIPKEEESRIAPSNPIANDPPPAPVVSSNVPEGVGAVQGDDGSQLEEVRLKEGEEQWSPIRSPINSLSGNVPEGVGPVHRRIGAHATGYTPMHPLTPLVATNVPEGAGTVVEPVSSGIDVTASHGGEEEEDASPERLLDDSSLHCNENFDEVIGKTEALPSEQPGEKEGEEDLSPFHPSTSSFSSDVLPQGAGTILGPMSSGIDVTASYEGEQEEDDAEPEHLLDDSFLNCNANFHELINQPEVLPTDQPRETEGEEDISQFHQPTSSLSSDVPEGVDTILEPVYSGILATATYDGEAEVDVAKLKASLDESIRCSNEIFDSINELLNESLVLHSDKPEQEGEAEDLSPILPPTSSLSSNVPEGVDTILVPVSSGIIASATYDGAEEIDVAKLKASLDDSILCCNESFKCINEFLNDSQVSSDQPNQKEGAEDLSPIFKPTYSLSGSMPQVVGPVWSTIVFTKRHGGLKEEEQTSSPRIPTAFHLPTPLISSNVSEAVDTIPEFVTSGRGSFDGVQEAKGAELEFAELEALIADLISDVKKDAFLDQGEVLPSDQPVQNEGGEENPTTIQLPTSSLSTSGTETGNEYAADEVGKNADKGSHEEGARNEQD